MADIKKQKIVSIFGTSRANEGERNFELAFEIGSALGEAGFAVANGGYGGTMLASAKGAAGAQTKVIGVTCSVFKRGKANEYVTEEIRTDSLDERLGKLVEIADAYVVLPGGTGTLLELAMVWEMKNKGFCDGNKPLILVDDFYGPLVEMMAADDPGSREHVILCNSAEKIAGILSEKLLSAD